MTVREGVFRQVEYLNGRVPAQDRMTVEVKAIVTAAITYILASAPRPQELYVALEAAVLAYLPSMAETTEEEKWRR